MKEEQKIQTKNTAGFMDSNVKHLYDAMISQGYTGLGDFSNFEGKMKDSGKRRMVYDYLIQDDYFSEIGDFSKFESALGYSPAERKDYVSQSSVNPAPIALRQEVDVPMKDQSEYVNPWTNSPDYNFESLRKKGKIETATPPPPTEYEKDSSFMNTWVGDAIQKLNAGGADLGAGIFGVLDKVSKGLESATGGLIPRGGAFKDISDRFKADAEFSRARSNRYNGKDFTDLWKEGNYMGAIGDIALQGVESLPMSIGAMAATMAGAPAAGLAGIGSIVASQKYDDLDQNNPNMGEFAKVSNAILTGTAESLSEMLGAGVSKAWMSTLFKTLGKEKAQEAIKRGIMGKMQEFYKKFGMFFEPVNEGIEEVSSTLAENITDKITGADPERDLTDGVLQSFVYGMGGGAYFTGAGALAKGAQYVADKIGGKQAQQPITDSNVTDQGVETPPLLTKSRFAEAEEEGRNMTDPGDIRTASKKMEETRLSLSGMVPGLASTIESYVDDGASEAQVMSLLDGVNADARPLAEDFYADYLRISGLQDRIGEEIDNEVETYVANNITPYVTTNPDGQSIVTTATLSEGNEERPVYVRSIEGDKAVISDNGQDRMVSVKRLSDIVEQDAGHMRRTYEDQLLATRQSELDMTMHHNPKTQLPKPGLIVWNGDNAFILQGQDENGDWIAQPAAYDRETGQVTAKNGSSPAMPITENEILDLQDAIYDAQQVNVMSPEDDNVASADAEITSAPPMEDAINQPTSEIETEGAIDQIAQPSNVENPSMVMREDGTPDFVSSGTDMALDFLYDKYGDKMPRKIEVTRKSFDESLKKASDALEKAQEAYDDAPIGKEDKAEAALIKARQEYEAIKVEADFWANLDDDIKEASKKPGDVIAKEISVIGDPMSGEELAAMMLANGAIKLTRDSYKKETGAGNNETAKMFGLFASPEKGGVNIERAGEILELADRENGTNFFDENDTNAGRDAIIEVLSSARTRGDLIDYVKRNREAIAERERQAEYNAYAEWCEENYHMSPEEYEAYEESMARDFSEKQLTDEERGELDSQIVDEIQAIIDEQNEIDAILAQNKPIENENIEGNDESGGDGLREGGGEVLPREQLDQTGGTGEVEGRESAGPDIDRTDGATQEGSSRGLVPFVAPSPKDNVSSIESSINDWSNKLNTPVRVIHDVDDINDTDENMLARKRDSKGWYDTSTGEIVIVSPNSTSVGDAQRTFLHEVVGHHGLRELFGDDFDTFLDNVYRNANEDIRKNIIDRTKGNPLNLREATEEYIAELAERGFDNKAERSLWEKIKDSFLDMLRKAGISLDFKLSDNDLRYILWRSYKNLEQGNLMDVAEDIVMRNRLSLNNINLNENGSIARDIEPEKGKQPSETKGTGRELETIDGVDENGNESERDHIDKPRGVENAIDGTENATDRNGKKTDGQVDNDGDQLDGGDTGDRNGSVRDGIGGDRTVIGRAGSENKGRGVGESVREKTDDFSFAEKTIRFRENARNESVLFADNDIQVVEKQVGSAKDQYERTLSTSSYQFQEAFQDSMLGLKTLQDAVAKATRSRILDYENAYMAENALSSVNEAEFNAYRKAAFEPILKAISRLEKMGSSIDEIRDYLITKHGIERNREMAVKRVLSQNSETYKSLLDEYIGRRNEIRENGRSWEEQQSEMDRLAEEYGANLSDDFSGFTSMYPNEDNTGYDPDSARRYVLDYESRYDTSELSASVKRATDAILAKQRDSGLMSQNTFDSISDMYQFYVPLRGWEETTADEVYAYLTSESQTFNAPIKTVVGRKSKADDPIATIANMAESGIMQGNRNLMKQKFLTMVQNHKTDLVSVSEMWVRLDETSGEWIAVFPDIPSNANPEQVESIVESFNKRMEELSNEKGSNVRRSRDAIGIPYKILPKDLKEHQVIIKRAGKEYVLTINGNPRAAQALNGLTNPDNTKGWFGTVERYAGWLNRNLAANFTTRNPNFMVSNFLRDALYSNTTVWVKESPVYAWKFNKNFAKVTPINMYRLVKGYENGTLDMSDPLNKAYHDFVMRGGETGYTNLRDVEAKKKAIQKELQYSKQKVSIGKALKILGEWMDLFNKSVENCARFTAFLTSREMGRSMDKSIYDAKEISVNFNKKGAGSKFLNTEGQTKIGNASAFTSGLSRSMYVFWNAGVQGMYNFGRLAKDNPKKFLGLASSFYLLGTIMPMIATAFGDDEDDDYYDLPEYVRRNNICFRNGGGNWITIPMPIELRAIYGLGEMSFGIVSGKEKYTDKKMAMKIAEQMSQVLPLDMMEGGGGFSAFVPSSVKPLIEAGDNKDWTGLPLYKDNDFNKGMPEWTKAFKSVDPAILVMTKYANELTGGDKYTTGTVNLNPAIIEHILDGYFGGIEATRSQMVKSAETAWGSRDFDWRNIPVGNRLIKSGDERTKKKAIDNAYYENLEEMDKIGQRLRGYRKELSNPQNDSFDIAEYQKKLNDLMMSDEYRGYVEFNNLNKLYQSMGEYLKKVDDERLEMELYDLKAMMNEIANGE